MGNNGYQGQITARDQEGHCFEGGQQLMNLIAAACNDQYSGHIIRLGIDTKAGSFININGNNIQIGKTGFYEINNIQVRSLYFIEDSSMDTIIDYII